MYVIAYSVSKAGNRPTQMATSAAGNADSLRAHALTDSGFVGQGRGVQPRPGRQPRDVGARLDAKVIVADDEVALKHSVAERRAEGLQQVVDCRDVGAACGEVRVSVRL